MRQIDVFCLEMCSLKSKNKNGKGKLGTMHDSKLNKQFYPT